MPTADDINTLVAFCARRDVPALTPAALHGQADVAILFGGSILAGADVFATAVRAQAAAFTMVVGGQGHSTDALRRQLRHHLGWTDVDDRTEAALFDRYLRVRHGIAVDALERESTNCGSNVTGALGLLRSRGVRHDRVVIVQDATMQQRMAAGFRLHAPTVQLVNFAAHRTLVRDTAGGLRFVDPPLGMWDLDRYVSMLMGEITRLTDDADGYGPAGRGFIAHVDVPVAVREARTRLAAGPFRDRVADPRWAG